MRGAGQFWRIEFWALLATAFAAFFMPVPAAASPIKPAICIRPALPDDLPASLSRSGAGFDCKSEQTSFGPGDYWARLENFSVARQSSDPLVLRFVSMWQKSASVYFRYADGSFARRDFSAAGAARYLTVGAIFEIPVPQSSQPLTGILIRINESGNVRGILLGAELSTQAEASSQHAKWIALYALFAGVAITLLVYNLALWAAMRHRFQLIYCGMLAVTTLYIFSASGALLFAIPSVGNNFRLQFSYSMLAMTALTAMLFAADFFGKRIVTAGMRRLIVWSAVTLVVTTAIAILSAPLSIRYFTQVYYAGYLPVILGLSVITANAVRKKAPFAHLFLLAWCWPVFAAVLRWLHGVGVIPYSFWIDNSSILAFVLEALVSSAVIAMRIRLLSRERDTARALEAAALDIARLDPLTGLLNRRGFLDAAIGREADHCLILIDIDHFKQVNDSFGHEMGDAVLQRVGLALKKWSSEGALIARLGGEEFAALFPAHFSAKASAAALLDHIRSSDQAIGRPVTASAGVATGSVRTEADWRLLYRDADVALYRAKGDGRDRVSLTTALAKAA